MRTHGPGHTSSADETLAALAGAAIPAAGAFTARAVATAMSSYTGSGTGTLTAVSGSIGTQDGVAMVTGDTLFIPEGLSNVSAVDAGPWYIQNAGSAMVSFVLIRPSWWLHGATMPTAGTVKIGPEGTFWPGTDWKSFAPKGSVVDTTDPAFFPGRVTQQITLAAGSKTVSNVPIRQVSGSNPYNFFFTRSSWILATSTIMYEASAASAGYLGSVAVEVFAATSIGTVAATDASIGNLTIENW